MVDVVKIASLLEAQGFKNVRLTSEYLGSPFHIVAERGGRFSLLVECLPRLDEREASRIASNFISLDEKSKGYWGSFGYFTYCVIADVADGYAVSLLMTNAKDRISSTYPSFKKGGGDLVVVETNSVGMERCPSFHYLQRELAFRKLRVLVQELQDSSN